MRKNVAHAAQIAFAFFTHVANEKYRSTDRELHSTQRRRHCQQCCRPGAVVGNPRTIKTTPLLTHVEWSSSGKHGIDVSAESDICRIGFGAIIMCAKNVSYLIRVNIFQSQRTQTFLEPLSAGRLAKRGRGNTRHLQLPAGELSFLGAKPSESRARFRQGSQACDLLLDRWGWRWHLRARGGGHGSSTTSYNVGMKGGLLLSLWRGRDCETCRNLVRPSTMYKCDGRTVRPARLSPSNSEAVARNLIWQVLRLLFWVH